MCLEDFFPFPWRKPMGYRQSVPPGRFFLPPLFRGKRGGQGVSLGHYSTAEYAENATYYSWRPPRPSRFQRKSVKMNVDDPVELLPYLFRFINLHSLTPLQGWTLYRISPYLGLRPRLSVCERFALIIFSVFSQFLPASQTRRGHTRAALGKEETQQK